MKLFKNPVFAVFLTVALVIASTLINTNVKFGRKCRAVTDQFYTGTVTRGTQDVSIASALESICGDAEALCVVAEGCGVDAVSVRDEVSSLRSSLQFENMFLIRSSYSDLRSSLTTMLGQLAQGKLDEQSAKTVTDCTASIASAEENISSSAYNETVRVFLRRYDHFPTSLLASLAGVEMPEVFS